METPDIFAEAVAAAMATVPTSEPVEDTPAEGSELPPAELSPPPAVETPPPAEKPPEAAPEVPADRSSPVTSEKFAPRLAKLLEREAQAVTREQRLKESEADVTALKAQVKEIMDAQRRFKEDPTGYIRKFAPDMSPAELAKALWYEQLGDAAPVEHRLTAVERAAKQRELELRAELDKERQQAAEAKTLQEQEEAHHRFVGALSSLTAAVPDKYPLVKSFAAQDPERATQGLYRMAQKHARATNGEVATPEHYAAMLQTELEKLQKLYAPAPPAAPPAPAVAAAPSSLAGPGPSSLRNKHTSVQPNKTDAVTEDEMFNAALEAARSARTAQG